MDIGSVVYSKAGRDKGGYYIVVRLSETAGFVFIADGETRRIEKPKLKKIRHLRDSGVVIEKLANKFTAQKLVHNAEVRSALKAYNGIDAAAEPPDGEERPEGRETS
ncbi:MAG: KOW domain-containing RNA-binding protein [Clostridiales bacterium]|jgi:ribosomal protein L14E/L6E/L27E|nr:KOW domain-containing RNA-binding protein [Clostridiales bacterium]